MFFVLGEAHLCHILARYFEYYLQSRTHLALDMDAPEFRPIELPATGKIVQLPQVGGRTTATSARPRSPAGLKGVTPTNAPLWGRSFASLRTMPYLLPTTRQPPDVECPFSPTRRAGVLRLKRRGPPSEPDHVMAKDGVLATDSTWREIDRSC